MYIDTYLVLPLWIFSIFGFICFLLRVLMGFNLRKRKKKGVYTLIVSAKNQEEVIEGVVRDLVLRSGLDLTEEELLQIVLLDLGSDDKTPKIMEGLYRDYSIVKLLKPEELPAYIRSLV